MSPTDPQPPTPGAPATPAGPATPGAPATPAGPATPAAPATPAGPATRGAPATPAAPTPGEPTNTAGPATPLPTPLTGPAFGSYSADDVTWLLKDLGDAQLEAPAAERERDIQSGRANYAETLPVEYVPSAEYQQLFAEALARSSRRVAVAVGVVTELVLAARGGRPVLVSLARAGTPIGILMKRWAERMHGIEVPHLTMSIVRGVGLDQTALRYLASTFDPARIMFVDGWTGKGAIARELTAALALFAETDGTVFGDDLAVLADPGHCVSIFGTRDDYLIPSACLNSTVSGLVSRTVFNRELIGPNDFHGAKFYEGLRGDDVSAVFLDSIGAHFGDEAVRAEVAAGVAEAEAETRAGDRTPSWEGWRAVERISADYGIDNVNLVKPGVGETTRVLLRRVPWKILVRPGARDDIAHVLLLAEQRGVPIEEVDDLPYSCVGLINPLATAGPQRTSAGADQ
ncbi:cysteine protease StiP family protein [Subtercola boreus]|uniref:cysteine protease StiP family protein n=1 Tax=Subtercola boreus TaxID=120213 RepID=UPI00116B0820|nr:cysteine protease StiP family protein [Subtercola boreus]TQL55168.1 RNA binding Pelota-like protein [Subtercola boreus]